MKCSICNNEFLLTPNEIVIAEKWDMYRLWIECEFCSKETRKQCEAILESLPKREVKPDIETFVEKMNKGNFKKRK